MNKNTGILALLLFLAFSPFALSADNRPNILLLLADDMSFAHSSFQGDPVVKTPTFDRLAREGVYFTNAHCIASSCTPSRGTLLTGRPIWQLEQLANLWGTLSPKIQVYPDLLERAGYFVGYTGKGVAPGSATAGGRTRNPAGPAFGSFDEFMNKAPADKPFCFWFGSHHPHRNYPLGSGVKAGLDPTKVRVPAVLPDVADVRSDICDYLLAIQQFDV